MTCNILVTTQGGSSSSQRMNGMPRALADDLFEADDGARTLFVCAVLCLDSIIKAFDSIENVPRHLRVLLMDMGKLP